MYQYELIAFSTVGDILAQSLLVHKFTKIFFLRDECLVEHKTCDFLAAEQLRLMRFDNRLIIDSFQEAICIIKW